MTVELPADHALSSIKKDFEERSGLTDVNFEIRTRDGGDILVMTVANPTERLFKILEESRRRFSTEEMEAPLATLIKKVDPNLLQGAEGKLLLRTLAESQNINRFSFEKDFLARYTKSVFAAEEKINASANHIVYGRRGAGKSTLLLYALHARRLAGRPSVWVDMQVYARRSDDAVIGDVLRDILEQGPNIAEKEQERQGVIAKLQDPELSEEAVRKLLPSIRRLVAPTEVGTGELFVFLDDLHVVNRGLQPKLLDVLYAMARGNRVFLKLSAIETLTRTFDAATKNGLEVPHDAQLIRLDYNLTMPDRATEHIASILDSHATYCGLPSIRRLCTSGDVIPRLTWVAAGVPRDALNLFSQAMTKATLAGRKRVSVSNINVAASEEIPTKMRDLEADASEDAGILRDLLESLKDFCIREQRRNAFLVEIRGDKSIYDHCLKLVDLRLLHVISEGITIGEAGRKYLGLILDYGFYTGVRAARSVDLFNRQTQRVAYKDLRKLPVYERDDSKAQAFGLARSVSASPKNAKSQESRKNREGAERKPAEIDGASAASADKNSSRRTE